MQYLKEDIKIRIITSALNEFRKNGFLGASMRNISKNAAVAIGNVYRYFENKEHLFNSIIEPVYIKINKYMLDIVQVNDSSVNTLCQINSIKEKIMEVFKHHSTELLILMDKSQGTIYEKTKDELINYTDTIIKSKVLDYLIQDETKIQDESMSYVLSSTLVEGICIILRKYTDAEKINHLIDQLINILFLNIQDRVK